MINQLTKLLVVNFLDKIPAYQPLVSEQLYNQAQQNNNNINVIYHILYVFWKLTIVLKVFTTNALVL